jgi:hypothetical protein
MPALAAGEAGGFNAVQKLLTNRGLRQQEGGLASIVVLAPSYNWEIYSGYA